MTDVIKPVNIAGAAIITPEDISPCKNCVFIIHQRYAVNELESMTRWILLIFEGVKLSKENL
jgi:hypothetical protein